MMYRKATNVVSLVLAFVLLLSVGGAFATWQYALGRCDDVVKELPLEVFPWEGSDILPEEDEVGKNHRNLIEMILNGTVTNANGTVTNLGLNHSGSYINNEIADRSGSWLGRSDTLGSMDFWEKSDIDKYFNTSNENTTFVIHFPNGVSNTYYLYTTDVDLETNNNPNIAIGEKVYPVYRTVLSKNAEGVWEATETKLGYAVSDWYDNRITGSWLQYPSFNPETWTEAELGTSADTAIWAYSGQISTIYPENAQTAVYYQLKPSARTSYTVHSADEAIRITVLDKNEKELTVTDGAQGSHKVTFTASANTLYYIKISGSTKITFTIS